MKDQTRRWAVRLAITFIMAFCIYSGWMKAKRDFSDYLQMAGALLLLISFWIPERFGWLDVGTLLCAVGVIAISRVMSFVSGEASWVEAGGGVLFFSFIGYLYFYVNSLGEKLESQEPENDA